MKGKVLGYDNKEGTGVITGSDEKRYGFTKDSWKNATVPNVGDAVDFEADSSSKNAINIYADMAENSSGGNGLGGTGEKSKVVAGILALFLGTFGIHKFYMGCNTAGIIMILIFFFGFILAGIPSFVIVIISIIEGIKYLIASDADFDKNYIKGKKCWF